MYQLALLLGQPPGALLEELTNAAPIPAAPPAVPVGLPSDLLQRRPDVQQAERQLAAATARVGAAESATLSEILIDRGCRAAKHQRRRLVYRRQPLLDRPARPCNGGFSTPAASAPALRVQNARVEQALAAYEQTMLAAFTDVETALTAYAKEQTRRQSLAHAAQANEQVVALAVDLYRHGLADFLRVLESQRSLYQSQDALIESERAVSSDLIALYKALGGGWEIEGLPAH